MGRKFQQNMCCQYPGAAATMSMLWLLLVSNDSGVKNTFRRALHAVFAKANNTADMVTLQHLQSFAVSFEASV